MRMRGGGIRNTAGGVRSTGPAAPQQAPTFAGVQNDVRQRLNQSMDPNPFSGLGQQLGGPRQRKKEYKDPGPAPTDPSLAGGNAPTGPQAFGTYAPDVNADQFQKENFTSRGLKGNRSLDEFGGLGGLMGSMGGMGAMGSIGGFGGFGGGGSPMDLVQMLMGLFGQVEDEGPIRGR